MKIALIKPPATYADWYKRPLLGISYISAFLESKGYQCEIFDAYFHSWSHETLVCKVIAYIPDMVAITAMTHEINQAHSIASAIKSQLKVPIVVGGPHLTALPEDTLREYPFFDYGIFGEGEQTILELVQYLEKPGCSKLIDIRGLVFRDESGHISKNEPRQLLSSAELDRLPYPAFHQYYKNPKSLAGKDMCYVMITSRGCPFRCAFCMRVMGSKVRCRSTENILNEIEHAISRYGAHTIDFSDEIFLFDNQATRELLKLMIARRFPGRLRWSALTRANFVTQELIDLAKEAGCYRVEMGVESGNNQILKNINKGISVEQVEQAVKIIKKAKVALGTYFILGHPYETLETIKKTIDLAVKLNTDTIAVGIMVPYPGTMVYEMARRGEGGYRLLSNDWSHYDKYGGKSLEIKGLPIKELTMWQYKAYIYFYLKNFRLFDLFRYIFDKRKAFLYLITKRLGCR